MSWVRSCSLISLLTLCSVSAHARQQIMNIEDSPIPAGFSMDQIGSAIVTGVQRGWKAHVVDPGHIEARLVVRTHVAVVDIHYNDSAYSITYKQSDNLDYKAGKIHRNYNRWVRNLDLDLQQSLQSYAARLAENGAAPPSAPRQAVAPSAQDVNVEALSSMRPDTPVTIAAAVPYAITTRVPQAVKSECRVGETISEQVRRHAANVKVGQVPSSGFYVDMEITEAHVPGGGAWSGPKWLEVTGTLHAGSGEAAASFRAKRFTTGGAFATFKSNCTIIARCANAIAEDIAVWLQRPIHGAELGDAR